ncbi:MAG: hypothetical protein V4714_18650 [Bacteroidota bacterium]
MRNRWILKGIKIALFIALGIVGIGFLVMTLWNNLIPAIFQGPTITFWQGIGLLILTRLLFSGFRPGWGGHRGGNWRQHCEKKMEGLSPEEREKIKAAYTRRCGGRFRNWDFNQSETQKKETV